MQRNEVHIDSQIQVYLVSEDYGCHLFIGPYGLVVRYLLWACSNLQVIRSSNLREALYESFDIVLSEGLFFLH